MSSSRGHAQCKVCWSQEQSIDNPLLNSCQCDGSVRYIHYECLKYWLQQKLTRKEGDHFVSYTWKTFECEICKKAYPYSFNVNGRKYRLTDYVDQDVPTEKKSPYLLLESQTFEKNSSRMVHIIKPNASSEKQIFKMGRGHESEIRVCDISVSRCHALLKYNPSSGCFYLEDNLSKFGTLVVPHQPDIQLEPDMTKAV